MRHDEAMPARDPAPDLADRLAPITLEAVGGHQLRLGDLWSERPLVLAHLRHFG